MSAQEAQMIFAKYSYMNYDENLNALVTCGIIDLAKAAEVDMALYQKRKEQVLQIHKNAISSISYIDHGREVTKYQTNLKGKKLRKSTEKELIEELYKHYFPILDFEIPTVKEAFKLWYEEREQDHLADSKTLLHNLRDWERYFEGRELTKEEIKRGKVQFKKAEFLDTKITEVKASQIIRHIKYLIGDGNITRKNLTNLKTPLIGAFSYAISHDFNCIDPRSINMADLTKRCKQPTDNHGKVYTKDMVKKLEEYLVNLEHQTVYTLAIRLCFNLGCRIGELRAIHWSDVDCEKRTMYLHRQIVDEKRNGKNRVASEKDYMKSRAISGKRELPLNYEAVKILEELRKINGDKVYILANREGTNPIMTNRFNENLKKACEAVGIPYFSSHKIRFGVVTAMYDAGISENIIQSWAGHSSITTTRHYDRRSREIRLTEDQMQRVFG